MGARLGEEAQGAESLEPVVCWMIVPEIVLGPPGTGKTTTLLGMVDEELADGVDPQRIGYVSFTKRAAREAVTRATEKFRLEQRDLRYFRTLHSMCFQSLGLSNGDVFEGRKLTEFGDWIGVKLSESFNMDEGSTFGYEPGDRALFMENLARVRCLSLRQQYEENSDNLPWSLVERIGRALEVYKRDKGLLDYTDMLQHFTKQEWSPDIDVLFVDEAQDLSMLQWHVVWKLAKKARRVVIAGDDDQAIYKWAGAAVDYFVQLRGTVTVLGQSWRVPKRVQATASDVIQRVRMRREKQWAPRDSDGEVLRLQSFDEVDLWGPEILVLARNAYVIRDILPVLRSEGVIYEWRGHPSVRQSVLDAVRTWEKLRSGHAVTADDARRVYDMMSSGIGVRRGHKTLPGLSPTDMVTLSSLRERGGLLRDEIWHEALDRIPQDERVYMLRARQKGEGLSRPRVRLSTIHGSKGGEAEHVVLLRDMALRTWQEMRETPEDEARVWYVGATRAKSRLSIVAPSGKMHYDI